MRLATLIILATTLALFLGCTPSPPPGQQPDDLLIAPGGLVYRANLHQQGVRDFWSPIQVSTVVLGENVTVSYRANIETKAGETRNNIVRVKKAGIREYLDLNLLASGIPAGIEIKEGEEAGGLPGWVGKVLIIKISQDVKPREYTFDIGIEFDGKDYGKIPCTIKVVQS